MTSAPRPPLSPYELRREGWRALTERLGVAGAIRFLMQYDPGHGDYTEERRQLLAGVGLDEALEEMRARGREPSAG